MMTVGKLDKLSTPWLLQRVNWLEHAKLVLEHENARLLVENEALKKRVEVPKQIAGKLS